MSYAETAENIIKKIGGEANIKSVTHCMTRLRFVLRDESIVDDEADTRCNGSYEKSRAVSGYYWK